MFPCVAHRHGVRSVFPFPAVDAGSGWGPRGRRRHASALAWPKSQRVPVVFCLLWMGLASGSLSTWKPPPPERRGAHREFLAYAVGRTTFYLGFRYLVDGRFHVLFMTCSPHRGPMALPMVTRATGGTHFPRVPGAAHTNTSVPEFWL